MSWARLLKRVFDIDLERCPHCGGTEENHRRHRRSHSDRQDSRSSRLGHPSSSLCPCATSLRCAILLCLGTWANLPWLARSLLPRSSRCFACVPAEALHGLGVRCSIAAHPCSARCPAKPSWLVVRCLIAAHPPRARARSFDLLNTA
jgi:hypothetical protein